MYRFEKNVLEINSRKRTFEYEIRQVIELSECYYVLLSIPFNKSEINNIFCVDKNNDLLWRAQDLNVLFPDLKNLPYEQMGIKEDKLYASDFYGRNYTINILNGNIEGCDIVK